MRTHLFALIAGLLFALGLGMSGMTDPAKVQGFLDFFGDWDPSLVAVMGGAIVVHGGLLRLVLRRRGPLLAGTFAIPSRTDLDGKLVLGSVLFGVGWALVGLCPGPAVVSLASGASEVMVFGLAMLVGMVVQYLFTARE